MCLSPDNGRATHKRRVLVVDDEPTLRLGFAYALTNKNSVVETAANGRQALEKIAETRFDIMILDLRMPDLDGLSVIDTLRTGGNPIPIVLCSAAIHGSAALRAIRYGVVDFLLKPVRPDELRHVIDFVLRPGLAAYPMAMNAARAGETGTAIQLLQAESQLDRQMTYWLQVLISLRDEDPETTRKLNESLPILAFNTTGPP